MEKITAEDAEVARVCFLVIYSNVFAKFIRVYSCEF